MEKGQTTCFPQEADVHLPAEIQRSEILSQLNTIP